MYNEHKSIISFYYSPKNDLSLSTCFYVTLNERFIKFQINYANKFLQRSLNVFYLILSCLISSYLVLSYSYHTCSRQCLVHRTLIHSLLWRLPIRCWYKPHSWHFCIQFLWSGLCELMGSEVPARTLKVQTMDVTAVIGVFLQLWWGLAHHLHNNKHGRMVSYG